MTGSGRQTPTEQHLGDRLAALVDGELGHDTRERVLAHLATCCKCKAEADAQRRLKNVFAETAPPAPSEGLLARLQGLPGGSDDDARGGPFGGGFGNGVFGTKADSFGYVPPPSHAAVLPVPSRERGFRIHEVDRSPSSRGRRFAFAAAGAVSLAAFALGGALPLEAAMDPSNPRADGAGTSAIPVRADAPPENARAERASRESGVFSAAGNKPSALSAPVGFEDAAPTSSPAATTHPGPLPVNTTPLLPSVVPVPPLIRQVFPVAQSTFNVSDLTDPPGLSLLTQSVTPTKPSGGRLPLAVASGR